MSKNPLSKGFFLFPTAKHKTGLSVHSDFNKHGLATVYQEIREGKAGTARAEKRKTLFIDRD